MKGFQDNFHSHFMGILWDIGGEFRGGSGGNLGEALKDFVSH